MKGLVEDHTEQHLIHLLEDMLWTRLVKQEKKQKEKEKPEVLWKMEFHSKALENLKLGKMLRNSELLKLVPDNAKVKTPVTLWTYCKPIRNEIFNYQKEIKKLTEQAWEDPSTLQHLCKCDKNSRFFNVDHQHVITGDLSIIKNDRLRNLLKLGPSFRKPIPADYEKAEDIVSETIDDMIESWTKAEGKDFDVEQWEPWKEMLLKFVKNKITKLKSKAQQKTKDFYNVSKALKKCHESFILVPADKAANNVIVVCKAYYLQSLISELKADGVNKANEAEDANVTTDVTYQEQNFNEEMQKEKINEVCKKIYKQFKVKCSDENKKFASMYWTVKMHKKPIGKRFIAASKNCITKKLSEKLTGLLTRILRVHKTMGNYAARKSNVDTCWVINNAQPIFSKIAYLSKMCVCKNVNVYDFKKLYTNIPHDDLKEQLTWCIEQAFESVRVYKKNGTLAQRENIILTKNGFKYTKNRNNNLGSSQKIITMVNFLIDNIYVKCGSKLFKQVKGIPMGTDCGPLLANLYLMALESKFINTLCSKDDLAKPSKKKKEKTKEKYGNDRRQARKFAYCFRYIDDLYCLNNDNEMQKVRKQVYPLLELEKQNSSDRSVEFLDVEYSIKGGRVICRPYDKRDAFGFDIVNFSTLSSNVHFRNSHGVLISQLLRFSRNCDLWEDFKARVVTLTDRLIRQKFSRRLLRSKCRIFFQRYFNIASKYGFQEEEFVRECFS